MIQDIFPRVYSTDYKSEKPQAGDIVFAFCGNKKRHHKIMVKLPEWGGEQGLVFPTAQEFWEIGYKSSQMQFLFSIDEQNFYLLMEFPHMAEAVPLDGYSYETVRELRTCNPPVLCFAAVTAYHLYDWYRINKFCGCCGSKMEVYKPERAMRCPECGNLVFPKICPAVIIGVKNGNSILVSHYAGRSYKGVALLAGFCEIGETVEETVAREVMEEVGLEVTNITYYKSQPWGFDSDLLMGFFCDVKGSTTITIDENELAVAKWVDREELENDPTNLLSLTANMIDAFRTGEIQ